MRLKHLDATVYAKQQPLPLVGDEHYPDGCAGITFSNRSPFACMSYRDVMELIEDLSTVAEAMKRA